MPLVPEYNQKPLQSIYNPSNVNANASLKQRNLVLTLCERHKVPAPDVNKLTKGQAAELLDRMIER